MDPITRQHVTDVFAVPVKNAEIARATAPTPARTRTRVVREPQPRTVFVRPMPATGCECDVEVDDPVRTHLQDLINDHSHHLCVCSPNRLRHAAGRGRDEGPPRLRRVQGAARRGDEGHQGRASVAETGVLTVMGHPDAGQVAELVALAHQQLRLGRLRLQRSEGQPAANTSPRQAAGLQVKSPSAR